MALSEKHRIVADEYLRCFNRRQAYRAAYPDTSDAVASSNSWRLWQNPEMQEYISKRLTETAMSPDEVLMRLAEHARSDMGNFVNLKGELDLSAIAEPQKSRLIKKLTQKRTLRTSVKGDDIEETVTSIELYDAQAALVHLGKYYKLFTDKQEITGADGKDLIPIAVVQPGYLDKLK